MTIQRVARTANVGLVRIPATGGAPQPVVSGSRSRLTVKPGT